MDCIKVLENKGYNLNGYSPDTYVYLVENDAKDESECESLFWWLEAVYG